MKILNVDHFTINLKHPKESFTFYESFLGIKKIQAHDMGDHILHLYQFCQVILELIEYKEPRKSAEPNATDLGMYRHFAFCVDDIEDFKNSCLEEGYPVILQPTYVPKTNRIVMLINDPNGAEIEIVQEK